MCPLDEQILRFDAVCVHRISGVYFIDTSEPKAFKIYDNDVPIVLTRLSVLEALGKLRCIQATELGTTLERI